MQLFSFGLLQLSETCITTQYVICEIYQSDFIQVTFDIIAYITGGLELSMIFFKF